MLKFHKIGAIISSADESKLEILQLSVRHAKAMARVRNMACVDQAAISWGRFTLDSQSSCWLR
jgi:hypothetical protein